MTYDEIKLQSYDQSTSKDGALINLMLSIGFVTLTASVASYLF